MLKVRCDTCIQLDTLFDDVPDKGCPVIVPLRQMAIRGRQKSSFRINLQQNFNKQS